MQVGALTQDFSRRKFIGDKLRRGRQFYKLQQTCETKKLMEEGKSRSRKQGSIL